MTAQRADELIYTEALPLGTTDERELAVAFKRGDRDAYNDIHGRYAPRVYSVCRRMLGNPDDAQEAAQEAFLRIYQGLPRFNGRYRLGAWVVRIATNVCLDQLRSRSRRPSDPAPAEVLDVELSEPVEDADPQLLFLRHAEGRKVRKVLDSLPPMHRAAIVLRDFEGICYADIAETLGITETQVKALLHRARRGFKRSWTTQVASMFLPFTSLSRLFRQVGTEPEPRSAHLTSVTHAAEPVISTGQGIMMTVSQAAGACSGAVAQCGQFVVDKAAPIVTALAVSAASVGVGVAVGRRTQEEPAPPKQVASAHPSEPAVQRARENVAAKTSSKPAQESTKAPKKASAANEQPKSDPAPSVPVVPLPAEDPLANVPVTDPSPAPSPDPSPSPSTPPVPAPPPWSFAASTTFSSDALCECDAAPKLRFSEISGKVGARLTFTQVVDGALLDAERDAAWAMTTEYVGAVIGSRGTLNVTMVLTTPQGVYKYQSLGRLTLKYKVDGGNYGYDFSGRYKLVSQTGPSEGMPSKGQIGSTVNVTPEGSVYTTNFFLVETSPAE
jgi:RNA polymerase sigma-70 factor, ECF subfamily